MAFGDASAAARSIEIADDGTRSVDVADLDGDGFADIVEADSEVWNLVCLTRRSD